MDPIAAGIAGFLIGAAAATVAFLVVQRRAAGDLDENLHTTIDRRMAEIRVVPLAAPASALAPAAPSEPTLRPAPRRRLWRDTSAVLVVIGIVLVGALTLLETAGPSGSVLEVTATGRPGSPSPAVSAAAAVPRATLNASEPAPSRSPGPAATTPTPSAASPTGSPAAPTPRPSVTAAPVRQTPAPSPSSDRYAVLAACQDRPDCYVYTVRRGDNLTSIANWFGIPYATVLELNPQIVAPSRVHAGDRITLPTPRR